MLFSSVLLIFPPHINASILEQFMQNAMQSGRFFLEKLAKSTLLW